MLLVSFVLGRFPPLACSLHIEQTLVPCVNESVVFEFFVTCSPFRSHKLKSGRV